MYRKFDLGCEADQRDAWELLKVGSIIRTNMNNGHPEGNDFKEGWCDMKSENNLFQCHLNQFNRGGWSFNVSNAMGGVIEISLDEAWDKVKGCRVALQTWPENSFAIKFGTE